MEIFDGLEEASEKYRNEIDPELSSEVVQDILKIVTSQPGNSVQIRKDIEQIISKQLGPRPKAAND